MNCKRQTCGRPVAVMDRNGFTYCKIHADRLPPYLRRTPTPKKLTTTGRKSPR